MKDWFATMKREQITKIVTMIGILCVFFAATFNEWTLAFFMGHSIKYLPSRILIGFFDVDRKSVV